MNIQPVVFRESCATAAQIEAHLTVCDSGFLPRLSERQDIGTYALKIARFAVTFEAWCEDRLVGMVAAYLNELEHKEGFVTSVSVDAGFAGRGIARRLVGSCLMEARRRGFRQVSLSVHRRNGRAIDLYEKFGFCTQSRLNDTLKMVLSLASAENSAATEDLQ